MDGLSFEFTVCILSALSVYFGSRLAVKKTASRQYIIRHSKILSPNIISITGAFLGVLSAWLYFVLNAPGLGVFLFMISWALDGVDGIVARGCGLTSERGRELDPLMDKIRYFAILPFIWYDRELALYPLIALFIVDFIGGQIIVRRFIKKYPGRFRSVAATYFGKAKTSFINLFILFYFYIDLGGRFMYVQTVREYFWLCPYFLMTLALASIISKMIPKTAAI
jgi:CDP-diacylglycerol--serine O-phosphatidyltransferase